MTPEQAQKMISGFASAMVKDSKSLQLVACKTIEGLVKKRVFNRSMANDNTDLGRYSKAYAMKRKKAGRGTLYKDLEFTGTLRESLTVGTNGNDVVFGFTDTKYANGETTGNVAGYLEKQAGKKIFTPAAEEMEKANKAVMIAIRNKVSEALKP